MKRILIATFSFCFALSLLALGGKSFSRHNTVQAQSVQSENQTSAQRPRCSNRSASGTYGYRKQF